MKKLKNLSWLLLCAVLGLCVTGCSEDNGELIPDFTDAEREALQVFNGTFLYEGNFTSKTIVFSPFETPIEKKSNINTTDVTLEFHGEIKYQQSSYAETEYYFYVDTENSRIVAYRINSENSDYFNLSSKKTWEYTIVDINTIKLYDTDLSNVLVHTYTYVRQ